MSPKQDELKQSLYCTIVWLIANTCICIYGYIGLYGYTQIHVTFRIFVPTISQSRESQHLGI